MSPWIPNTVISSGSSSGLYSSAQLVRYVDYVRGSDSNSGFSPALPMKNIQTAYDNLRTVAEANYTSFNPETLPVGTIYLLPGDHQVGAGLDFEPTRPVRMIGTRSGQKEYRSSSSESRVRTTSAVATEMIRVHDPLNPTDKIGVGFSFENIPFVIDNDVNTALTRVIYTYRQDFFTMAGCAFSPIDIGEDLEIYALWVDSSGSGASDHAWCRIRDNRCAHMSFLYVTGGSGGVNYDRWTVADNWTGKFTGSTPHYRIIGAFNDGLFAGNCAEGDITAFSLEGFQKGNCFVGNSGESNDNSAPFIDLAGGGGDVVSDTTVIGGRVAVNDASNGIYVQFGTNCYNNRCLGGILSTAGRAGYKAKIVDSSGLLGGGSVQPILYKAGSSISDGDFAQTPDNGTVGITYNSGDGAKKIWFRANNTWVSVTGA